jgi:uncharacterized membrane protein
MKFNIKIVIFFLVILIFMIILRYMYIYLKVDSCLDHGFTWNYVKNECIERNLTIEEIKCYSQHCSWIKDKCECVRNFNFSPISK